MPTDWEAFFNRLGVDWHTEYRWVDDIDDPRGPALNPDVVAETARRLKQTTSPPIILDWFGDIIAGHVVWQAATRYGITRVPTYAVNITTAAQAAAIVSAYDDAV